MKVADLQGAYLTYWVARARGIPAIRLAVINKCVCVTSHVALELARAREQLTYAEDYATGGPLLDDYNVMIGRAEVSHPGGKTGMYATARVFGAEAKYEGEDALEAGMRAIVGHVFGPEVPDFTHTPQDRGHETAPEMPDA